jgi:hypothetical protein
VATPLQRRIRSIFAPVEVLTIRLVSPDVVRGSRRERSSSRDRTVQRHPRRFTGEPQGHRLFMRGDASGSAVP